MSDPIDPITRLNAALEGRYTIERELGEGGMATVYLADDLKHERKVALKVLKPELAAVVGAERFLAEIKTTANLTHPHILPLFDSGEADSFLFYVMPHIEGETLRERIDREKQLPVDEAVKIATDLAEALDYAHRHKIIHRDIKPANILLHEGRPLIADFGIALAIGVAGGGRLTETGLSVGTPHYMSPEQATGDQAVGVATDIYALGAVLYEMLVGDPPYTGSTAQAILGKIIQGKLASATEERATVPPNVDAAIRKALEKLPADRFVGAQAFAKALGDPVFRHGAEVAVGESVRPSLWNPLSMAASALALVSTMALGWSLLRPEPPLPVSRQVLSTEGWMSQALGSLAAVAPDGSSMVLPVDDGPNGFQLGLKIRGSTEITPIPGTENGGYVTYSPDGQWITYAVGRDLFKRPLVGGSPVKLAEDAESGGSSMALAWLDDGTILYETLGSGLEPGLAATGMVQISENGGEPLVVFWGGQEGVGQERRPIWAHGLPGAQGALVAVTPGGGGTNQLYAVDLRDRSSKLLLEEVVRAWYTPTGHLVYVRTDGGVFAAPFDLDALEITGGPIPLFDGVAMPLNAAEIQLSADGTMLFVEGSAASGTTVGELVWVARSGEATPVDDGFRFNIPLGRAHLRLAPDGGRIAYAADVDGNVDVWIKDLSDGATSRLTFREGSDSQPVWSPDGESITYLSATGPGVASLVNAATQIFTRRTDGAGSTVGLPVEGLFPRGWSPDSQWLLVYRGSAGSSRVERDIFTIRPGVDAEPSPLLAREDVEELYPALSPDGRWIAYVSNETGQREIFVRPFPDVEDGQWQVSLDGGQSPLWAHNGRELFFFDPSTREIKAADFTTTANTFRRGQITSLFTIGNEYSANPLDYFYDIGPDDDRFIMARRYGAEDERAPTVILVQNFFEELERIVPD